MLLGPDGFPLKPTTSGPVELDLAELSAEEQFTVLWLRSIQPNATPIHVAEFRDRALGMTPAQSDAILHKGIDGLLARGFLTLVKDRTGQPVVDARGRPQIEVVGKLVSRMQAIRTPKMQ